MLACDGSDLNIFVNPKDTYFQSQPTDKGYNQLHLNALFDLCNKRYVDVDIQPARKENEVISMSKMVDRYSGANETIITNLPQQSFQTDELKQLYAMRWGIETSFRELKYAIGLTCFHSKKVEYIEQEIYV